MVEGLDRDKALNLHLAIMSRFYDTLSNSYHTYSYSTNYIWNYDEAGLQYVRNYNIQVIARRGSRNVPKIIPKSRE